MNTFERYFDLDQDGKCSLMEQVVGMTVMFSLLEEDGQEENFQDALDEGDEYGCGCGDEYDDACDDGDSDF